MKYSVTEARNNMRKLLNQVDDGEEVIIVRYDSQYSIVASYSPGGVASKQLVPRKVDPGAELCEHGQLKGECLVKGCKFGRKS